MNNRFVLVMLACVAAFIGLIILTKNDAEAPSNQEIKPTARIQGGTGEDSVRLIEYGDFECPACGAYYPILKEVKSKYGDKLSFEFRHYPLVQIHPNAMAAHRAAEAAGQQDKFFEMHDKLYENQQQWRSQASTNPAPIFESYAQELSLDLEKFKRDVASSEVNDIIQADIRRAQEANATSTPTFIFEGKKIETNPRDVEGFSKLIDEAFSQKESQ